MEASVGKWRRERWRLGLGLYRCSRLGFQAWMVMRLSVRTLGHMASIGRWGADTKAWDNVAAAA